MPTMLITLEPIKAPTKAVAARIRLVLHEEQYRWPDVDPPHGPNGDECEIFLEKQDDAEWERRRRNRDQRVAPPAYRILTLYVHDMGTHRRVTMHLHTEEGRPMATMIEDMLRQEQWLDDAPAAQGDQAPGGDPVEVLRAPAATHPVPKRKDVIDRVRQAHELLKDGKSTPSAVFRDLARIDKKTYQQYCRGVTGEDPVEL